MSKSRRVFLSIKGNDDFWGNGDCIEEKASEKRKCRLMEEDEEEEMEEKYFFRQSNLTRQRMQKIHEEIQEREDELDEMFEERNWKLRVGLDEHEMEFKSDEEGGKSLKYFGSDFGTDLKSSLPTSVSTESTETFYTNYRNFFKSRPEVLFLVQSICEDATDSYSDQFLDLYEKTRKKLETFPNPHINQILRRTCPITPTTTEQRVRSKHAVVVSNFREPDRRLGRYSKYYYHHNVGPEVYSRKVFVGGLPACVTEMDILDFFARYGRLQVDWPSKHYGAKSDSDPSLCNEMMMGSPMQQPTSHLSMVSPPFGQINPFMTDYSQDAPPMGGFQRPGGFGNPGGGFASSVRSEGSNGEKRQQHLGYVFLLFEKERSVRDLVTECFEEEEGLFITLETLMEPIRVQIRPWLLADAEFLMDFNVPINTKLVAFIGGVPRPLKAVELAHFFEQTYGNVVCVGIDIDNKFKYPRGSGRVAFSNYDAYVQAITDRYIVLDHEDIHKRVEIKPYFFHNQSCEECSGRYHRQHAPFFCPSLECFQYYCEPCWQKMHAHPSRFHHMPVVKGV